MKPGPIIQELLCMNFYYDAHHQQVCERGTGHFRIRGHGSRLYVQFDNRHYPAWKVIHLLQTGVWPDERS